LKSDYECGDKFETLATGGPDAASTAGFTPKWNPASV
jgi:hypothetical protein